MTRTDEQFVWTGGKGGRGEVRESRGQGRGYIRAGRNIQGWWIWHVSLSWWLWWFRCYIPKTYPMVVQSFSHGQLFATPLFDFGKKLMLLKFSLCSQVLNRAVETRVFGETGKSSFYCFARQGGPGEPMTPRLWPTIVLQEQAVSASLWSMLLWLAVFIRRGLLLVKRI